MRSKQGAKDQKVNVSTGRWLKWYFYKKTCRRIDPRSFDTPPCGIDTYPLGPPVGIEGGDDG